MKDYVAQLLKDNNLKVGDKFEITTKNGEFDDSEYHCYRIKKDFYEQYDLVNNMGDTGMSYCYVFVKLLSGNYKIRKIN